MQLKNLTLLIILFFVISIAFAQRGKDGAKIISTTEVVNAYTMLSTDANAGATSISVNNSALATNFSNPLAQGDLIMIYQVQGASVEDTVASPNANSSKFFPTWGRITNYNNTGNYELVQVASVPNATTINLDCPLSLNYTASGRVLIIRVPRYTTLTINNGGNLTTTAWNATSGGVVAVEVLDQTTINAGGKIDVTGLGFRGGTALTAAFSTVYGGLRYADANQAEGAEKGEGIAGDQSIYATFNAGGAGYCRGAAANAGGGGNAHNAGGGGGANAGNVTNWNDGVGNPDISNPNYITAWNLEPVLSSTTVSSGGGRGGYSILRNNRNELTEAPGNTNWGGDNRRIVGGLGGRPLDYSTGKIFMGGGGGAGDGDNAYATDGGNGGGIIFLSTYDDITGAGKIIAHGANGVDINPGTAGFGQLAGGDAPGGAGGGGAIILKTTGNVAVTDSIAANGGNGGNQFLVAGTFASIDEGQGPGGGGGGGYIAISAGTPNRFANGGINGITNSPYVSQFPPNGATMGGVGLPNETINNSFDIMVTNDSICSNSSATLGASLTGTPPSGTTIEWFDAQFNGNLITTGTSFTTPVLTATTTYWVRACPAPYLVPVTAYVVPCNFPVAALSASDSTICINDCINFNDLSTGTPTSWSWYFFGSSTPTSSQQNPTNICYPTAGTFDVALVVSNTNGTDSIFMSNFITVNPLPTVITSNDTAICNGSSTTISASGASSYSWDNGLGAGQSHTVNPTTTTTYVVIGTDANGCQNTDNVIVTVNPLPTVVASNDTTICNGSSATISASGATSYSWDNGLGDGQSHTVNPTTTTTYLVIGTDANGCQNTDNVIVTVNPLPVVVASNDTTICNGSSATISASGATSYSWDNGLGAGQSHTVNPTTTTTYVVTGTDANGCQNTDNVIVTVNPLPVVVASNDTTICNGSSATISASGATSYSWDNGLGNGQSHTVNPTTTTTYVVTGTDVNGCQNTDNVIVTVTNCGTAPTASFSATDSTICINECIDFTDLSSSIPTGWSWYFFGSSTPTSSQQNPTNICYPTAGTFDVALVATNSAGSDSIFMSNFITVNPLPTVVANNDTAICNGNSATISASGAISYSWDNGLGVGQSHTVNPTTTTTYVVTGTDVNGCQNTDNVIVTVNPLPVVVASNDTTICNGSSATISASGATSYSWDNGLGNGQSHTVSPTTTTTYIVIGTDVNGCQNTDNVIVTVTNCGTAPTASFSATDSTICINECIDFTDLSSSIPTGWSWYFFGSSTPTSSQQNPTNICYPTAGTFDVALVATNSAGSDSIFMSNFITVNPLPTVIASNDTTICNGSAATISASGATSYSWDNSLGVGQSHTVNPTTTTTYVVTGTDANGCQNTDNVIVTVTNCGTPPIASFSATDSTICINECIDFTDLSSSIPTGWSWYFFGSSTPTSSQQNPTNICYPTAGTFDVALIVSNTNGTDSIFMSNFITVNPLPTVVASNDTTICSGSSATISASGATSYNWDNGLGAGQSHTVNPTTTSTYVVTGTDANGCQNTDNVIVTVVSCGVPTANLNANNTAVCINDCVDFTDLSTNTPTSWLWFFEGASPTTSTLQHPQGICYDSTGTYNVTLLVNNAFGTDTITMNNYIVVDSCLEVPVSFTIPNVFSPNNDGNNDVFFIESTGVTSLDMQIYNRWGMLMFETSDINATWNGRTSSGTVCPEGTYFYIIKITTDKTETFKGTLTLLR